MLYAKLYNDHTMHKVVLNMIMQSHRHTSQIMTTITNEEDGNGYILHTNVIDTYNTEHKYGCVFCGVAMLGNISTKKPVDDYNSTKLSGEVNAVSGEREPKKTIKLVQKKLGKTESCDVLLITLINTLKCDPSHITSMITDYNLTPKEINDITIIVPSCVPFKPIKNAF